ncbi:Aste57867_3681 [Aphanomyces stellatus]|uniref:Aste57867_3681 protein n=1 Tax=Aphanomyces stellatus TaxID=120398 RepID=A0A485KFW7_9STRA|nr:hypothetical protein As57867_003670 [Aphanomyces stellatus]VFT80836.1 Aste57867_3681 [Aphanomyces stellatus]
MLTGVCPIVISRRRWRDRPPTHTIQNIFNMGYREPTASFHHATDCHRHPSMDTPPPPCSHRPFVRPSPLRPMRFLCMSSCSLVFLPLLFLGRVILMTFSGLLGLKVLWHIASWLTFHGIAATVGYAVLILLGLSKLGLMQVDWTKLEALAAPPNTHAGQLRRARRLMKVGMVVAAFFLLKTMFCCGRGG